MKNLKIKQACLINGKHFAAGEVAKEVDTRIAAELVHMGRAVEINNAPKEAVVSRDPVVENRDPEVEAKEAPESQGEEEKAPENKGKSKK